MRDPTFEPFRFAHEHYAEVAWMSQNANHLVPGEIVQGAIRQSMDERRYQDYPFAQGSPELRELVLRDLGLPSGTGWLLSAGGTEALYMLTRALLHAGDEVIASDPSYLIIHKFIELAEARTVNLDIYAPPFRLTPDRVQEAITPRTKMILLIDPLNPLGSGYPEADVRAIAEIAHDRHLLLLNDVTYRDFAEHPTLARTYAPEGTLTVWSVSKNCGLAGLRLGGLVGPTELLRQVARYNTNDLGVNVLAQVAAIAALRTKSQWIDGVRRTTRANQERIHTAAAGWPGISLPVFPSQANMFALDVSGTGFAPEDLQYELLTRFKVFVRAGNYLSPKFGARFVRASFSNPPEDIDRFLEAFPAVLGALRSRTSAPTVR
jgi:aspartate/methionine/tyrosine aminotransferase